MITEDIRNIIQATRLQAVHSVDFCRVQMYWQIGCRIVEEEQNGNARAEYGTHLLKNLSKELEPEYGSGFGLRQLEQARKFYIEYPNAHTLCAKFNWSQYKLLISVSDTSKREFYELETAKNNWTFREMKRQVYSFLYERLLMSADKESVLAVARGQRMPQTPEEIIKEPMVLEFLGLKSNTAYYESELEEKLISHIQEFMMELGNGFAFIARQKRILLDDNEFFVDLVFYNRLARRFVVMELKTNEATHQDIGQLQMYVNYYDRCEKLPDENPTIGILLCAEKSDTVVKMTLPADNNTIVAAKYQLYLPSEEQLKAEVEKVRRQIDTRSPK